MEGRNRALPLSFNQERIWFIEVLEPGTTQFCEPQAFRLEGNLDLEAFNRALQQLVKAQACLRTRFETREGKPFRIICEDAPLNLEQIDLTAFPDSVRQERLAAIMAKDERTPFDLSEGPPLRAFMIRLAPETHYFILNCHHLITDGWSRGIFNRELSKLYNSATDGEAILPVCPEYDYSSFVEEQGNFLASPVEEQQLKYWENTLSGLSAPVSFPRDRAGRASTKRPAGIISRRIPDNLNKTLKDLCRQTGATDFIVLLTVLKTLLWRLTGNNDIIVGSPVSGRVDKRTEAVIGVFIETLALRTKFTQEDISFLELVELIKRTTLDAYDHQRIPFEKLVEQLHLPRNPDEPPLFRVLFNYFSSGEGTPLSLRGIEAVEEPRYPSETKYDLTFYVGTSGGQLQVTAMYRQDLFTSSTTEQYLDQFQLLLEQFLENPELSVNSCSLVTPRGRSLIPDPKQPLHPPKKAPVIGTFMDVARRNPDSLAVKSGDQSWSYSQLRNAALGVAEILAEAGVRPGETVGISGKRSFMLISSVLGVMYRGGIFYLLDPSLPEERRNLLIREARVKHLIYLPDEQRLPGFKPAPDKSIPVITVCVEDLKLSEDYNETEAGDSLPKGEDPAYIFFTSGTTGKPKAVLGTHKGLSHFIEWERTFLGVGPDDRVAQLTGISFDVILRDIFLPLVSGASLCIPEDPDELSGIHCPAWIERENITILHTGPSLARTWLGYNRILPLGSLRFVLFAGEPLPRRLIRDWKKEFGEAAQLLNIYGPTETSLAKAFYPIPTDPLCGIQPIGYPLPDTQFLVLNGRGALCGIREPGEIVIRTPFRTKGYLNLPEENRKRFIPNPFTDDPDDLLYRTGDLGAYSSDGSMLIFGRNDDQIKIRGIRIDPNEISGSVQAYEGIAQCVVAPFSDPSGQQALAAYFTTKAKGNAPSPAAIREHLKKHLPQHMIPATFIRVETMPLNANGKVDKSSLPEPQLSRDQIKEAHVPAESQTEKAILAIWKELLGLEQIGIKDNFFDLGGHSLLATTLVSQVGKHLEQNISLAYFLEDPTILHLSLFPERREIPDHPESAPGDQPVMEGGPTHPLSFEQEGLWVLDSTQGGIPEYNLSGAVRLEGKLRIKLIEKALQIVVRRHDSLRTQFSNTSGRPSRIVRESEDFIPEKIDFKHLKPELREMAIDDLARRLQSHVFDLSKGPLFRFLIVELGRREHLILWSFSHLIFDERSEELFLHELTTCYNALQGNEEPELGVRPLPYSDYCRWQRDRLGAAEIEKRAHWWKKELQDAPPLDLYSDRPVSDKTSTSGAKFDFIIPEELSHHLSELSTNEAISQKTIFSVAFNILLSRFSDQNDIVTGTTVSNRENGRFAHSIGFFLNTMVRRMALADEENFLELAKGFEAEGVNIEEGLEIPFQYLVESLELPRNPNRHPVFQVMITVDTPMGNPVDLDSLRMSPISMPTMRTPFDLHLVLIKSSTAWKGSIIYKTDLYDASTVGALAEIFIPLLGKLIANNSCPVKEISAASDTCRRKILEDWNSTSAPYHRSDSIHELFSKQVALSPDAIALEEEDRKVSFQELDALANQAACTLMGRGVAHGDRVGLHLDRSIDLVVSMLGILKSGAAYVPLATDLPQNRLRGMVENAKLKAIVTAGEWPSDLQTEGQPLLTPQALSQRNEEDPSIRSFPPVEADAPAYIIHTSGSTGAPKGVVIPHRGVVRLVRGQDYASFGKQEKFLLLASPSFDASTFEIWGPLLNGGTCSIYKPRYPDLAELKATIQSRGVTTIWLTAGLFNTIVDADVSVLETVRHILAGGEALSVPHVKKAFAQLPELKLTNGYGPTESTTFACTHQITEDDLAGISVPIGRPISNTTVYILDSGGNVVPPGVIGECCIGGDGLAIGYLNEPQLTEEKFIRNPFSKEEGSRLYRTGDLCRYSQKGLIEFVGRKDNQIKIRGFRVELNEVQTHLAQYPAIQQAVAVGLPDKSSSTQIVGYYVPENGTGEIDPGSLKAFLREFLPDYAIPSWLIPVEKIPLTTNGKVDFKKLPRPDKQKFNRDSLPRTPMEVAIARIWESILSTEGITRDANFFDLGGHSMLAARFTAELENVCGKKVSIARLFDAPTIRELAAAIEVDATADAYDPLIPLRIEGSREPLFCLPGMGGDPYGYILLANELAPHRPVYGLKAAGADGHQPIPKSLEEMSAEFVSSIRKVSPSGPYNLLGFSGGGWVAFAVAHALRKEDEEVRLHIFDTTMVHTAFSYPIFVLYQMVKAAERLPFHLKTFFRLPSREKWDFIRKKAPFWLRYLTKTNPERLKDKTSNDLIMGQERNDSVDPFVRLICSYRPKSYPGDLVYFCADPCRVSSLKFWKLLIQGRMTVHYVSGGHFGLIDQAHIRPLGSLIAKVLDQHG